MRVLSILREEGTREFLVSPVIGDALAALALPRARLMDTGAMRLVLLDSEFRRLRLVC
jgi:hypothetical protein